MKVHTCRRDPPSHIKQQLRQEAGFGCVKCGCPILEYHHIVEWRREHHFRAEDMVAVCRNCHARFANMRDDEQRHHKSNPLNARKLYTADELTFKIDVTCFEVGGNIFLNCNRMIYANAEPILEWTMAPSGAEISATLFERDGSISAKISRNDLVVLTDGLWDMEYKTNYICLRDRKGSIQWQLDLRKEPASFRAITYLNEKKISIDSKSICIGSGDSVSRMIGNVFPEGKIGISIFDDQFVRPRYWDAIHVSVPV